MQLDVGSLWLALDADRDGEVGLEAICAEAAEALAHFKERLGALALETR